jgi:hypothetical protein
MNVRTNLLLPEDLVREVDRIAGPRNRSRYFADAARKAIRRDQLREVVDRTAGVLKAEDYPYWATSDDVVAWVRASRAEVTDPGPVNDDAPRP